MPSLPMVGSYVVHKDGIGLVLHDGDGALVVQMFNGDGFPRMLMQSNGVESTVLVRASRDEVRRAALAEIPEGLRPI